MRKMPRNLQEARAKTGTVVKKEERFFGCPKTFQKNDSSCFDVKITKEPKKPRKKDKLIMVLMNKSASGIE